MVQQLDEYGYERLGGVGRVVADELASLTEFETRVTVLGHVRAAGPRRLEIASSRRASD